MPSALDRIFKAYDVRGVVPDDLDADSRPQDRRRLRRLVAAPRHRAGPRLPAEFARTGRRARRRHHRPGRRRDRPRARLHRPAVLRVRFARRARHHAHGEPQPQAVQRPEVLPGRREAGRGGQRACARSARSTEGPDSGSGRVAGHRAGNAICSTRTSTTCCRSSTSTAMRPLTVVADTANGMGGLVVPAVMARLPVTLHHLYAELDGTFPNHPADPIDPENQRDLKAAVLEHGADVGPGLRRRRRPGVPDRRAGPGRERFAADRPRGDRDARSGAWREGRAQPDLLVDRARGRSASTAASPSAPGWGTRSSSR